MRQITIGSQRMLQFGGGQVSGTVTALSRRGSLVMSNIAGYPPAFTVRRRISKTQRRSIKKTDSYCRITPVVKPVETPKAVPAITTPVPTKKQGTLLRFIRKIGNVLKRAAALFV